MNRRLDLSLEHGYTMIAVMLVLLTTSLLAAATFALVGGDIPFARASQDRKQAYAAAEAGVEYYLYQLARDNDYWTKCDQVEDPGDGQPSPVNLKNPGGSRTWRNVSGSTQARFSIEMLPSPTSPKPQCDPTMAEDTMLDKSSGTFRIRSTGVSQGERRSIIATLRRTSFLDYLYFTDYEASDPLTFPNAADQSYAAENCVKYRIPRNQDSWCRDNTNITFQDWDAIYGPLHTNDDLLTCGSPIFGRDEPGKIDRIEIVGPAANGYTKGSGCTTGQPDFNGPVRQPAQYLPVPTSNDRLADVADTNYVFEGQTVIRFNNTSTMSVTTYPNGVADTNSMPLPPNGVIYVETAPGAACTLDAPRQIDYDPVDSTNWRCPVLTVSGTYPKSMTLGSQGDILIDGDIKRSGDVVLGLVAQRFVRVKHDVSSTCGLNVGAMDNVTIEAAILALSDSFIVDNYPCGEPLQYLTVTGAIAQKFRGPVGTFTSTTKVRNHGYAKNYKYDDRLRYRSPPYFLDPVVAAWRVVRNNEQVRAAQ
ncbi:MAG TPA: hypothetical protein VFX51_09845 [Solirubrobacteraceae bacterium]|nr:hypothetical protein [Solirubrobacteraceae bacterium]